MADPGFPRQRHQPRVSANLLFDRFSPQNFMKMKEIGKGLGAHIPNAPPPDPSLHWCSACMINMTTFYIIPYSILL